MSPLDFERFFELSLDMLGIASVEGRYIRVNIAFQQHLGWPAGELTGQPFTAFVHPEEVEATSRELDRLTAGASTRGFQTRYRGSDGNYRLILWTAVRDAESGLVFMIGRDLTEQDETEQRVRAQERRFQALIEHSADVTVLLGVDGRFKYLSPSFEAVLGFPVAQWLGQVVFGLIWPDDVKLTERLFARSIGSPGVAVPFQLRLRHPAGGFRWLEGTGVSYVEDPATEGIVINCRDITERKRAEEALLRSSDLLGRLAQQVPGVIYQYRLYPDGHSCFPFATDAMREIYEVTPEEVREDASVVFGRLHPDDYAVVAASIERSARTLEPWRCDYRVVLPVQGVRWRSGLAQPERKDDGSILWHGFISDVTEKKLAEEELRRKEAAIASSINGIAMSDLAGTLTYVNRAFLDLWGYRDPAEVLGRSVAEFTESPEVAAEIVTAIQTHGAWSGELVARRPDGITLTLQTNGSLFTDSAGKPAGMLGSFVDVTESKRLQQQFLQAQKMDSVGRLAGGVAHDFNNLLTVMKGYLELARLGLAPDNPVCADLSEAAKAADSAGTLTQQLLAFSRKQLINPKVLNLNDVVLRVEGMLHRVLGEDIELRTVTTPKLGSVRFDPGQGEQILINLAVNARDAMPKGGTLTIETANARLDESYARTHPGTPAGDYVMLAVSDTGSGMTDEVKSHLFEPFFTTKAPGSGTGLGLAMIFGAVSQNGGRIDVYSELGHGTTFRIFLPRVPAAAGEEAPEETLAPPRGKETILLVEDDDRVRRLAARLLERLGYRVLAYNGGPAAIEAVRGMVEPLHLLMTDVIMPVMNGQRLSEEIRLLRPGIRVLFTSGYTADVIMQHGVLEEGVEFLAKPYSIGALAQRVREVLERPAAAAAIHT
ncbi:MAG TPA: PAS domain S-box protein [Gemmatimonadales bacterium]|nr:PAS domain S-box protein [Gemmatimonadales bacterium]